MYYDKKKTEQDLEVNGISDAADHVEELSNFINTIFAIQPESSSSPELNKLRQEWEAE